jgi:uncharacterized protein
MPEYDPESIRNRALSRKQEFRQVVQKLKTYRSKDVDAIFSRLHHKAFEKTDCTKCAGCCRTLGPRIIHTDVERIAPVLNLPVPVFKEKYLRVDEDGDMVFKSMPCPFLNENNLCAIYHVRPRACREYPHTDQRNIKSILSLCIKNTETCPAVLTIFETLVVELKNH